MNNCPNCGAPIEHYYNYQCPYCKTFLHNTDENIKNFNNVELIIDDVYIEREFQSCDFVLNILGRTSPKIHYYINEDAYNCGTLCTTMGDINKKVGYRIRIPTKLMYLSQQNPLDLLDYIFHRLPPIVANGFYEDKIEKAVYDLLYRVKRI